MPIQIIDGFQVNSSLPIDNRIVASGSVNRDAIPYKYEGLRVFDTSDGLPYVWLNNTWVNENSTGVNGVGTTTNYIPRFSNTNVVGNSVIFQTQTTNRIGINTTTPGFDFEVNGDISVVGSGKSFRGVGSGITQINASNITSGNLALAQLTNGTPGHVLVGGTVNPSYLNPNQLTCGTSSFATNATTAANISLTHSVTGNTNYLAMFTNATTGPVRKLSTMYYDSVADMLYFGTSRINRSANSVLHEVIEGNGFDAMGMAGNVSFSSTPATVSLTQECLVFVEVTFVSRIVVSGRSGGYINGTTKLLASYHVSGTGTFTQLGTTTTDFSVANTVGTPPGSLVTPTINTATNWNIAFNQTGTSTSAYQYYTTVNYKVIINKGY